MRVDIEGGSQGPGPCYGNRRPHNGDVTRMTPVFHLLIRILTLATFVSLAGGSRSSPRPGSTGDERVSPGQAANSVVFRLAAGETPRAGAPLPRAIPDLSGMAPSPVSSRVHLYGVALAPAWSSGHRAIGYLRRIPRMGSEEPPRHG